MSGNIRFIENNINKSDTFKNDSINNSLENDEELSDLIIQENSNKLPVIELQTLSIAEEERNINQQKQITEIKTNKKSADKIIKSGWCDDGNGPELHYPNHIRPTTRPEPLLPDKCHPLCYAFFVETSERIPIQVYCEGLPSDDDIVIYSELFGNKTWKEFLKENSPSPHLEFPTKQWNIHRFEISKMAEKLEIEEASIKLEDLMKTEAFRKKEKQVLGLRKDKSASPREQMSVNRSRMPTKQMSLEVANTTPRSPRYSHYNGIQSPRAEPRSRSPSRYGSQSSSVKSTRETNKLTNSPSSFRKISSSSSGAIKQKVADEVNVKEKNKKRSIKDRIDYEKFGCLNNELMQRMNAVFELKLAPYEH